MQVGLFFGSFNPVHIGHLIIASHISNFSSLDQIWFVVSPQNPFKEDADLLEAEKRKNLIDLAIQGENKLRTTDVEFSLSRPSYTINTLEHLKTIYPDFYFTLIIGSDSFQNINAWKDSKKLINNYNILIYTRPGYQTDATFESINIIQAPLLDISSTQIREMIKTGKSIKFLVPDVVKNEIEKKGYYK
jgi:nicotinate-nucleotide adenylyltransferase